MGGGFVAKNEGKVPSMRFGVIGASGTLGRVMVTQLTAPGSGDSVRALVRQPDPRIDPLATCVVAPKGPLDREALRRFLENCDVVINLAARNPAGQAPDLLEVHDFFLVNGLCAALVAVECANAAIPLVHFSSVAVYEVHPYREAVELDERCSLPSLDVESTAYFNSLVAFVRDAARSSSSGSALAEDTKARVDALTYPAEAPVYGLSKLVGERAVLESEARSCCLRLSDVFGRGHESRGVISDHLRALRSGAPVIVDLGFRKTVYLIAIEDALFASRALAQKLGDGASLPEVINVVGHRVDEPMLAGFLQRLGKAESLAATVRAAPPTLQKVDRRYDPGRLRTVLPHFTLTPFHESLSTTWAALARA